MNHLDAIEALNKRFSANKFDRNRPVSEQQIQELVAAATQAPSAFNIQHWRFIAVTDPSAKERLKAAAYGQQKVTEAAVTFIILGDLLGYEKLPEAFAPMVAAKKMSQDQLDELLKMANGMYSENAAFRRDEAIRSGAMAAMNLMTAATAMGLVSGPMIGFDPGEVKREFGISDRYVSVMLVTVGYEAPGNWPKKPRFPVEQVLSFNQARSSDRSA